MTLLGHPKCNFLSQDMFKRYENVKWFTGTSWTVSSSGVTKSRWFTNSQGLPGLAYLITLKYI